MNKKYIVLFSLAVSFLFAGQLAGAQVAQNITDWYIKDFQTNIIVNKDSSLDITENIVADCGNLPEKHGIFRVLPTKIDTGTETYSAPISLVSITDFNGKPYKYETVKNKGTITWRIGDPNVIVTGENDYRVVYKVGNAIRFGDKNFDELYWNLMGNFWTINTKNFSAALTFPPEVTSQNAEVDYYTGNLSSKSKSLATYSWDASNVLHFVSVTGFKPKQGVTVSVTFPKNIFTPYVPSFAEKYASQLWDLSYIIPLLIFIFGFSIWKKYGKEPKMKNPIPPEFGIPDLPAQAGNITPMQMGAVISRGVWKNNFMTAAIVDLAVRKFITIEQIETKVLFFSGKDIVLKKVTENYDLAKVTATEKLLLERLFNGNDSVNLSSLRNRFYRDLPAITKSAWHDTVDHGWMVNGGNVYRNFFILIGAFLAFLSVVGIGFAIIFNALALSISMFISGIILVGFGVTMPNRTQAGTDLLFRIKGFELYMKQAENFRQQFYEKENIFDKFLPYAIVFGIADLWAKKMQLIYGEEYFKTYHPIWLVGTMPNNFNISHFTSQLNGVASGISRSPGSRSGAHGGGFSGGGGGGGGGGGW